MEILGLHNSALKVASPLVRNMLRTRVPAETERCCPFVNVTVTGHISLTGLSLDTFILLNSFSLRAE
jgi:hypothetical protein